jgi:DnaJ-class molecular chaperone
VVTVCRAVEEGGRRCPQHQDKTLRNIKDRARRAQKKGAKDCPDCEAGVRRSTGEDGIYRQEICETCRGAGVTEDAAGRTHAAVERLVRWADRDRQAEAAEMAAHAQGEPVHPEETEVPPVETAPGAVAEAARHRSHFEARFGKNSDACEHLCATGVLRQVDADGVMTTSLCDGCGGTGYRRTAA